MKYTIPTYKQNMVVKKLNALNNRIKGMKGCTLIEFSVSPTYEKLIDFGYNEKKEPATKLVEVVDIDVINPVVVMNGWSFLAVIEHSKVGNMIMKKLYDVKIPEQYLNSDTYCEHCNTDRYRKYTYLVYKLVTGEIHQVGSTCLTAYLGFDASLLLAHATFFTLLNDMMEKEHGKMDKRGIEAQELETFIKRTICYTQRFGYVSAKKVREHNSKSNGNEDYKFLSATGTDVWGMEYARSQTNCIKDSIDTDETKETYTKIIEWVKGLEKKSDYIHNIQVLVNRGYVTYKTATTAASIVGIYFANMNKKKVEDKKVSNHFGNFKERIDVDMVLKTRTPFEGQYGSSNCYRFETIDGNIAVWFTASVTLEEGKRYVGKATISKHDDFKGSKQTIITRCKLTEVKE